MDRLGARQGSRLSGVQDWRIIRAGLFRGSVDMYRIFDELREHAPVWQAPWGDYYVSCYDLVSRGLADTRLSHVPPTIEITEGGEPSAMRDWLMYQEGSAHAEIRKAFQIPFRASGMELLRLVVDEAVENLVSTVEPAASTVDVVSAFARAIPERVIGRLLGVPDEDMPLIRAWSASIRSILDTGFDSAFDGRSATDEMSSYFEDLSRRFVRDNDLPLLLSGLPLLLKGFGPTVAGRNLAFLAFAGHETTVHLLGNMLFHLAQAPDIWAALRDSPDIAGQAVTETLRLESPVQKICRWPTEPISLEGYSIEKGALVVLLIGAANRDGSRFPEPDRFVMDRRGPPHLAFGRGAHVCIGRTLAEMEGRSLLRTLVRRWRNIELGDALSSKSWMDNSSFRGLERLLLRVHV